MAYAHFFVPMVSMRVLPRPGRYQANHGRKTRGASPLYTIRCHDGRSRGCLFSCAHTTLRLERCSLAGVRIGPPEVQARWVPVGQRRLDKLQPVGRAGLTLVSIPHVFRATQSNPTCLGSDGWKTKSLLFVSHVPS